MVQVKYLKFVGVRTALFERKAIRSGPANTLKSPKLYSINSIKYLGFVRRYLGVLKLNVFP